MSKKEVVHNHKKTTKHSCFSGQGHSKLTPTEKEVLFLLTHEFLTPNQIAIRRQRTQQSVSKIMCSLKKKGAINIANHPNNMVVKNQPTSQPTTNFIRLHGQEFNIKILWKEYKYKQLTEKSNTLMIDGNTIRLYKNSIEIYSGQSFYADDTQKATVRSMEYWSRFFARLEHEFKVILVKPRSQNIKLVNQHYAETNNELSQECEKKSEKIKVYTTDDGRLWFTIDNSFNLHEAETLHPHSAKEDMQDTVKPFFNDMRDKSHYLPSQIRITVEATLELVKEVAAAQLNQTKLIEALLPKPVKEKSMKQERPFYVG